jgi:hypothetical protein
MHWGRTSGDGPAGAWPRINWHAGSATPKFLQTVNSNAEKPEPMRKILLRAGLIMLVMVVIPLIGGLTIAYGEWSRDSERRYQFTGSSEQAPKPELHDEAIVQVYAARAARWRGIFGVHSWIAYKKPGADSYLRTEVIGWGARYQESVVVTRSGIPDRFWYGYEPELLADIRGADAERAIGKLENLIENYPYANRYQVWPGPNSNTYTAHLLREVEELPVDLPPTAIGKDYLDRIGFQVTPSNTGFQFVAHGVFAVTLALDEGIEINLLGATYGLDLYPPALKLPCIGRIGF